MIPPIKRAVTIKYAVIKSDCIIIRAMIPNIARRSMNNPNTKDVKLCCCLPF